MKIKIDLSSYDVGKMGFVFHIHAQVAIECLVQLDNYITSYLVDLIYIYSYRCTEDTACVATE